MKKNIAKGWCVALIILGLLGCKKEEKEKPDTLSLAVSEATVEPGGGSTQVQVSANCSWTVSVGFGGDWLTVSPTSGQMSGSFTLSAGANKGADRTAMVKVASSTVSASLTVTQKAQGVVITSIKEVRALYKGSDVTIQDNVAIRATVISNYRNANAGGLNNYTSLKAMVVSDGEAGIQLYCAENNEAFLQGDQVEIALKGQTLSVYSNGPLQVNGLPLAAITKVGTAPVQAKTITVAQFLTGAYESMYVAIPDVQIGEEFLNTTFVQNNEHTSIGVMAQTKETFDIFSSKYASYKDTLVPSGSGTLKGIGSVYGNRYQLSFAYLEDFAGLTGERFYTEPTFSLNTEEKVLSGDAGQFSVSIASNVDWTVTSSLPSDFVVSPTSGQGTKTLTVTYTQNPSTESSRAAELTFSTTHPDIAVKTLVLKVTQNPFQSLVSDPVRAWMEMPAVADKENFVYIAHNTVLHGKEVRNFSYWYDTGNRVARWVAYPLYRDIIGSGSRSDTWDYDPKVPKRNQPTLYSSYSGPYDRGHQIASADRLCTQEANKATFYFTNITPQNGELNQKIWGNLEIQVRNWAKATDTLYVVTGAVLQTKEDTEITYTQDNMGKNVAVPKAYFKVLLNLSKAQQKNDGYSAIGFWLKNEPYPYENPTAQEAKSIRDIEALTGFDFFTNLPKAIADAVEVSCVPSEWGLE